LKLVALMLVLVTLILLVVVVVLVAFLCRGHVGGGCGRGVDGCAGGGGNCSINSTNTSSTKDIYFPLYTNLLLHNLEF